MDNCIFCQIIKKQLFSHIVYEDENYIAFLDIKPVFFGHVLIIPKSHHTTFYDLNPQQIAELMQRVKLLGKAVEAAMEAEGSFIAMNNRISQSVPHVHVHVIPRKKGDGLKGFFWPRQAYGEGEMARIKNAIMIKAREFFT